MWFGDFRRLVNYEEFFAGLLSAAELERAGQFRFDRDRVSFVLCRGLLRTLLGRYLDLDPTQIEFVYGAYGKPALSRRNGGRHLRFNVAHAAGFAVLGITQTRRIGIDVEYVRHVPDLDMLAERFFAPREADALRTLSDEQRTRAFFDCWTRKEAFIKAVGLGLTYPLDRFTVSLLPHEPAQLFSVENDANRASGWWMAAFQPAPGYTGAIVVDEAPSNVQYKHAGSELFDAPVGASVASPAGMGS